MDDQAACRRGVAWCGGLVSPVCKQGFCVQKMNSPDPALQLPLLDFTH